MSRDESVEPPVPRRDLGWKIAVRQFRDQQHRSAYIHESVERQDGGVRISH